MCGTRVRVQQDRGSSLTQVRVRGFESPSLDATQPLGQGVFNETPSPKNSTLKK